MAERIILGEITADVVKKNIKNIHLSVYPPNGAVRISAPLRMDVALIRIFAISKLGWIKQQQKKVREQDRETPREYIDRESHFVWGKRYLLNVIEHDVPVAIELKHTKMLLHVRSGTDRDKRQTIVDEWFREQLKQAAVGLIAKWEPIIGVKVRRIFVQNMKTKWGSCNPDMGSIRLNTELAKKPHECLEYLVVHEMVHLLEPTHNPRFVTFMDHFMPKWRHYRDELNRLPVRHELWKY